MASYLCSTKHKKSVSVSWKSPFLILLKPAGHVMHRLFNIQQMYALPTWYCIYLRTNSDLCHLITNWLVFITEMKSVYSAVRTGSLNKAVCACATKQHKLIGFYNRDGKCLQRGTDWVFKWSCLRLCHLQHKLIGFYNRDEKCLQRGTDWVFK
jgi:hypothetical protein